MKIGILTYHAACNFGANLQALSTYSYLQNNGHTPVVIDWTTKELREHYQQHTSLEQYLVHQRFREDNLIMTRSCFTDRDIADVIVQEKIDAVIIGSDAVMQHHPFWSRVVFPSRKIVSVSKIGPDRMCPNPFWGSFLELLPNRIPIAFMSASSQNSHYQLMNSQERTVANKLLSQFTYISTRDDWSSNMVSWITKGKISPKVTPDPVFAFNYNVKNIPTEQNIRERFNIKGSYYLLSFHHSRTVSQKWLEEFQNLAQKESVECIAMSFPDGINYEHPFKHEINIPLSPLDWFALIKYSNGYIGHNMHPIVVSLHNAVPCFSFDNYGVLKFKLFVSEESSKIYHIMKTFGVLDNRISCISQRYRAPSPAFVIERLKNYDRQHIKECSERYLERYKQMMQDILKSFCNE